MYFRSAENQQSLTHTIHSLYIPTCKLITVWFRRGHADFTNPWLIDSILCVPLYVCRVRRRLLPERERDEGKSEWVSGCNVWMNEWLSFWCWTSIYPYRYNISSYLLRVVFGSSWNFVKRMYFTTNCCNLYFVLNLRRVGEKIVEELDSSAIYFNMSFHHVY